MTSCVLMAIFEATAEIATMATRCPSVRLDPASQRRHQFVSVAKNIDSPLLSLWSISFCPPPTGLTQFNLKWCYFLTLPAAQFPLSGRCASSRRQVRWLILNAEWVRQSWQLRDDCEFAICSCFVFFFVAVMNMKSENPCRGSMTWGIQWESAVQGQPLRNWMNHESNKILVSRLRTVYFFFSSSSSSSHAHTDSTLHVTGARSWHKV